MLVEPEISGVTIVLVGSLNPRIFTPDWFARHGLISGEESDKAEIEIVHRHITKFRADWLNIQVEDERFQAITTEAPYIRLHDLIVRTFRDFLSHTPLTKLGINREIHFNVGSQEARDQIGHRLAPPKVWGDWAPMITAGKGERQGGMVSLTMLQPEVDDRPKGYIKAKVEPSVRIKGLSGVYVEVNDHYEIENPDKVFGCEEIISLLEAHFEASIQRSEWIIDQVARLKNA